MKTKKSALLVLLVFSFFTLSFSKPVEVHAAGGVVQNFFTKMFDSFVESPFIKALFGDEKQPKTLEVKEAQQSAPTRLPNSAVPQESSKINEPDSSGIQPAISKKKVVLNYNINYYDFDSASNRALVSPGLADPEKINIIERVLSEISVDPAYINQYSIVFMKTNSYDGEVLGILMGGKQVIISSLEGPTGSEGAEGVAHDMHKYIILSNSLTGSNLESVFIHEMGHLLSKKISTKQFVDFMESRNMSKSMISSWQNYLDGNSYAMPMNMNIWEKSANEDFAEVIKVLYSSNKEIKTVYGPVNNVTKAWIKGNVEPIFILK